MSLRDDIVAQQPVLDRLGEFIFLSNHKVASTSINRNALKERALVMKDDKKVYQQACSKLTDRGLHRVFKFTVVRNPWDRVVSAWAYLRTISEVSDIHPSMSFEQFIDHIRNFESNPKVSARTRKHIDHQHPKILGPDGLLLVDFIGRLERIRKDWETIAQRIGNIPHQLPKANQSVRATAAKYYNDHTCEVVARLYQKDIVLLGYKGPTK